MRKVIEVKPLKNYRVWLKFSDGAEGTVDLSELAGKGVFSAWEDVDYFNSVFIDEQTHTIAWEGGIDLCPDNLYAKATGANPLKPLSKEEAAARREIHA
ncbi:MAG: DUF2442 domain-containing protein [bacterium]